MRGTLHDVTGRARCPLPAECHLSTTGLGRQPRWRGELEAHCRRRIATASNPVLPIGSSSRALPFGHRLLAALALCYRMDILSIDR